MAVTQTLRMTFLNQANRNVTLSLDNPRDNLTAAEVQGVMDTIIAKNIFTSSGGDLVSKVSASIIDTTTTELFGS
ncbi:MAG TPA: DUF2922 domain-containing protein [Bacillota bacterium]|nr:DUF2922 domain-containing protein [Peptococcaceae bacterium MAG4]HPZ43573.1 DUF2922 domain-containing protein [Bacillota bacterium]HQD75973.1 DUF2922 domain-containing protein [Bacillota bacterium]HUM58302.1 DUF2922 domain-containing protein [Bacillota bacterium]